MAARASSGARDPADSPSRMTNTLPSPVLKTNPAPIYAVSKRVGRGAESMAYTAATLSGRTTDANARTSASTLTLPCLSDRTVRATPGP